MAAKKTKPPILPRNYQDPTGADALERRAMKDFAGRMNKIGKAYKAALDKIPSSRSKRQIRIPAKPNGYFHHP